MTVTYPPAEVSSGHCTIQEHSRCPGVIRTFITQVECECLCHATQRKEQLTHRDLCDRCQLEPHDDIWTVDMSPPGRVCFNCADTLAAMGAGVGVVSRWRQRMLRLIRKD